MERDPEEFWEEVLSGEAARVREAWKTLTTEEQVAVRLHLRRMTTEEGWLDVQRASAFAALLALDDSLDAL